MIELRNIYPDSIISHAADLEIYGEDPATPLITIRINDAEARELARRLGEIFKLELHA